VEQEQNILVSVKSWAWTSSPMTASKSMESFPENLGGIKQKQLLKNTLRKRGSQGLRAGVHLVYCFLFVKRYIESILKIGMLGVCQVKPNLVFLFNYGDAS
jgi:hypothetical protein